MFAGYFLLVERTESVTNDERSIHIYMCMHPPSPISYYSSLHLLYPPFLTRTGVSVVEQVMHAFPLNIAAATESIWKLRHSRNYNNWRLPWALNYLRLSVNNLCATYVILYVCIIRMHLQYNVTASAFVQTVFVFSCDYPGGERLSKNFVNPLFLQKNSQIKRREENKSRYCIMW